MIVEMRKHLRKTRRHCNRRTRKRGGEGEETPWNNAHINQYRQLRTVGRNRNLQHTQFISNISKKEYDTGLEEIRQRIYALMAEKDISDDKDRIQKEIDELTVLGKKIKKETRNKMISLNEALHEYVSNLERQHQRAKIVGRINSNADADLAGHNANTKRIQAMTRELRVLRLSNRTGQNHYQLKRKLDLERGKHSGGNITLGLSNRNQFNHFMKTHLSSSNNLKNLANIAAYHSANSSESPNMQYNSNNTLNVRRPNTIRTPIELPIAPPQGSQGLRNFQASLLANQRLRRARNTAKQFMKTSNE